MSDDVNLTSQSKRLPNKRKPTLYKNLPPPTDFKNWWEDPDRTTWCNLLARAIVLEALQHVRETKEAAERVELATDAL